MFYNFSITVTKDTPASAPEITEIELAPGEIQKVSVGFPWGCAGLVHVQIFRSEHQVWPTNVGDSFAWNDYNYEFEEAETCLGPLEPWSIRCWNLDQRHPHTIQVRFSIISLAKTTFGRIAESLFGPARRT